MHFKWNKIFPSSIMFFTFIYSSNLSLSIPLHIKPFIETNKTSDTAGVGFDDKIYVSVEQGADYPGGGEEMAKEVSKYLSRNYPRKAIRNNIQGKVFLNFVVEKDGSITNIKVLRGKELGGGLAEAGIEALNRLKKFIPGRQDGKPVRQYFNFPINFTLSGGK